MSTDISRLPPGQDGVRDFLDKVEVESVLVRSAYCVKDGARRAFRQQIEFFTIGASLIGGYTWIWAREAMPLVAMPLAAWLMSLWLAHRVGVREVSEMADQCLGPVESTRPNLSEDPAPDVLPREPSRSRRT